MQNVITPLLNSLHYLRTISLHLDFPDIPRPSNWSRRGDCWLSPDDVFNQKRILTAYADALFHALDRSDYEIRLLGRSDMGGKWLLFHVSNGESVNTRQIMLDEDYHQVRQEFTDAGTCSRIQRR